MYINVEIWKKQNIQGMVLFKVKLFTKVQHFDLYIKPSSGY